MDGSGFLSNCPGWVIWLVANDGDFRLKPNFDDMALMLSANNTFVELQKDRVTVDGQRNFRMQNTLPASIGLVVQKGALSPHSRLLEISFAKYMH